VWWRRITRIRGRIAWKVRGIRRIAGRVSRESWWSCSDLVYPVIEDKMGNATPEEDPDKKDNRKHDDLDEPGLIPVHELEQEDEEPSPDEEQVPQDNPESEQQ